jgi:hypothetical protein
MNFDKKLCRTINNDKGLKKKKNYSCTESDHLVTNYHNMQIAY